MRKILSILMIPCILLFSVAGCGQKNLHAKDGLSIVTTIFPVYDWVMQILGEQAETADVTMLLDNGADLHNYQPTADDIIKISECDVFIYIGGESDQWVADVLKEPKNKDMTVLNLMDVLGASVKEEEVVEGMEAEELEEDAAHAEELEYDEHIWLSLKNAAVLCDKIAAALEAADAAHKDLYQSNAEEYIGQIHALDARYQAMVEQAPVKTLLFGDRFPFRYLTDDYGLDYYAAFSGCSAETEASFETVTYLAGKIDELGLSSVLTLEGTKNSIADTIISATKDQKAQILVVDSMQSATSTDIKKGASYLGIMEQNLAVFQTALK